MNRIAFKTGFPGWGRMRELLRPLTGLLDGIMSRFVLKRVYTPETQLSHTAENITTWGIYSNDS